VLCSAATSESTVTRGNADKPTPRGPFEIIELVLSHRHLSPDHFRAARGADTRLYGRRRDVCLSEYTAVPVPDRLFPLQDRVFGATEDRLYFVHAIYANAETNETMSH